MLKIFAFLDFIERLAMKLLGFKKIMDFMQQQFLSSLKIIV